MASKKQQAATRGMHQTTVRFGGDLWESLRAAAEREGVSVAQYVRDAALRRVAYETGRRDERAALASSGELRHAHKSGWPESGTSQTTDAVTHGESARRVAAQDKT